jgi:sugar/nucleoside kinase (ribokinase family)
VVHWPEAAVAVPKAGEAVHLASVRLPEGHVRSANGAGDAFAGGMLYGLHEGWPLERCLKLAHANAACSLRSLSTTGAIEPWQQTLALAGQWGWRD